MDVSESIDIDPDPDSPPRVQPNRARFRRIALLANIGFVCVTAVCLPVSLWLRHADLSRLWPAAVSPAPLKNHIAFAGNDGNIWLIDGNGENLRPLTTAGRRFRAPTWSPDGRYLAFIGADDHNRPALFLSEAKRPNPQIFYSAPVSAPFYLYWAADSQTLAFLTQETSNLAIRTISPAIAAETTTLDEGSSFYWVWSPAGDRLFMHVGGSAPEARLSFLDNRPNADRIDLDLKPGAFQAPAWSADGQTLFYVTRTAAGGQAIVKINADSLAQETLVDLPDDAPVYLAASADNTHLAYLQAFGPEGLPRGQVYLVNVADGLSAPVSERTALSFYWSPDGRKLALLTFRQNDNQEFVKGGGLASPLARDMALQWWVYSVETDELRWLTDVNPTLDFMQIIPFFDQYHHSISFWSPDSRYLAVVNARNNIQAGTVLLVDTSGREAPRPVGEGTLAVWSWQ